MSRRFYRIAILDDDPRDPDSDLLVKFGGRPMYVRWIHETFEHELNTKNDIEHEVLQAESATAFKLLLADLKPGEVIDLALVDMKLNEWELSDGEWIEKSEQPVQGRQVAEEFANHPEIKKLVVLTAYEDAHPEAVLIGKGITEYWSKLEMTRPLFSQQLESIFDLPSRYDLNKRFNQALKKQNVNAGKLRAEFETKLVGQHPSMLRVKAQVCEAILADSASANFAIPVLITGETGTGKEEVARLIHKYSRRGLQSGREFPVALNCAEFVEEELLRAEMFGHTKGAFTGAVGEKRGKVQEADCSTLFLDEVGLASPRFQSLMLRAMEESKATPVGGVERDRYKFDVRFIAATDQDVFGLDNFSKAFLHRLSGMVIHLPPLRERRSDIKDLVAQFLKKVSPAPRFTLAAEQVLEQYEWPGNVRQLKYVIELLASRCRVTGQEVITRHDIELLLPGLDARQQPADPSDRRFELYTQEGFNYDEVKARFAADYVHSQHQRISGGQRSTEAYGKTAQALSCSISTVKERLADYRRFFGDREGAAGYE
jgi:DNA-binding NtrC family response regulator